MRPRHGRLLPAFSVILASSISAAPIAGNWEYKATKPDPMYGEPESLLMTIAVSGCNICGSYMSAYRGGMRVAEGELHGKISGNRVLVQYEAGWNNTVGTGVGQLVVHGGILEWQVSQPGPEPDYMLRTAKLRPSSSKLEIPAKCK